MLLATTLKRYGTAILSLQKVLKMRHKYLLYLFGATFYTLSANYCYGQEGENTPKNFPGLFGGVEWNSISGLVGIDYERILYIKNKVTVGAKGMYVFRYKQGNLQLINAPCCGSSSFIAAMGSVNYFTSKREDSKGFFLHSGLGVSFISYKESGIKGDRYTPAFEAGLGWLFPIGSNIALKWTNTITFATDNGGITLSKVSIGF
jgi:hypothetical protein